MNVDEKILQIKDILREGQSLEPGTAKEYHRIVTGQYAFISAQTIPLIEEMNEETTKYRKSSKAKSEAEAKRMFDVTETGKILYKAIVELKVLEKMMSTLKLASEIEGRNWKNAKME